MDCEGKNDKKHEMREILKKLLKKSRRKLMMTWVRDVAMRTI
jgi:hypothetical protein